MTDDINEIPGASPNLRTELGRHLEELVPEAIADGKVDVVKLQELLTDDSADDSERFGLFWPGKKRALRAAQEPTTATLRPVPGESKDWDTTQNVFIEGDNLEVLKILQRGYHNKVKMIYIDPPYNTGKDFVYPDNFREGLESYLEQTKQWAEGEKLRSNPETEGQYHSNWLNMMYPRLKLARNLLTQDGALLISIDDHEQDNLKRLCVEVFGEKNVEMLVWNKEAEGSSGTLKSVSTFRRVHEYVIVCHRDLAQAQWERVREALEGREDELQTANLAVNAQNERADHENYFSITNPNGDVFKRQWKWGREQVERLIAENLVYWGSDGRRQPRLIIPTDNRRRTYLRSILDYGGTTSGRKDFESSMGSEIEFSYPKPILLIKKLILAITTGDDIVVDFFSGSGTTGHAVMQLNAEDGGTRAHIQVQLPEPTAKGSGAHKAGLKTIADVGRRRIDLAGAKIKADVENSLDSRETPLDIGYRTYRLVDTNFSKWRVASDIGEGDLQQRLLDLRESSNDASTEEDLLSEILLKQGYSLSEHTEHLDVAGLSAWRVGAGDLVAYLNEHVKPTLDQLRELAGSGVSRLVIVEDAFHGDDELKTNLAQLCKTNDVELWTA